MDTKIINGRECVEITLPTSKEKVILKKRLNHGENIEIKRMIYKDTEFDQAKAKAGEKAVKDKKPKTFDEYIRPQLNNDKCLVLVIEEYGDHKKPTLDWLNSLYDEDVAYIDKKVIEIAEIVAKEKKK